MNETSSTLLRLPLKRRNWYTKYLRLSQEPQHFHWYSSCHILCHVPELLEKEGMHGSVLHTRFEGKSHAPDIVTSALIQSMKGGLSPKPLFPSAFQVSLSPAGMESQLWSSSAMVPVLPSIFNIKTFAKGLHVVW